VTGISNKPKKKGRPNGYMRRHIVEKEQQNDDDMDYALHMKKN
jgi:hypothetical protein